MTNTRTTQHTANTAKETAQVRATNPLKENIKKLKIYLSSEKES
jgi:hypothetical protein